VKQGVAAYVRTRLSDAQRDRAYASDQAVDLEIKGLKADESQRRFSASLLLKAQGQVLSAVPVGGRYEPMERVPMLKRALRSGEEIAAEDIAWQEIPTTRARDDYVRDEKSLIGQSPRRTVSAMRPIRSQEVGALPVLKKNALVQMSYRQGSLDITTSGVILEDGAVGQSVRVRNTASNRVVQAMVEDAQRVRVMSTGQQQVAYAQ
jgi:flagellar basal body P-ring formation protein FlgA